MNKIIKKIDRYEVLEQIGQGGMAVVYKVKDTRLNRIVALKMIRTDSIPKDQHQRFLTRFEREAQALANLDHPNIIPVYDYGEFNGNPYIVMKYQSGGTLKDKMGSPMNFQEAANLLIPIANALAYAHENGIIHRDVKPSNILLNGRPMLADFGIAKMLESDEATLTGTGVGVGTPEYMAPEQWKGKPVYQTDTYSLGVVFYELITGQKPYTAETPLEIGIKQATEPLTSPIKIIASIPNDVETVLFKAMALNPNERFDEMKCFEEALKDLSHLDNQPDEIVFAEKENKKAQIPHISTAYEIEEQETMDYLDLESNSQEKYFSKEIDEKKYRKQSPDNNLEINSNKEVSKNENQSNRKSWISILMLIVVGFIIIITIVINNYDNNVPYYIYPPTSIPKSTPTYAPIQLKSEFREIDGMEMVYVSAGEFEMGADDGDSDEQPLHKVYLDAYWIDKYEVTNQQYANFLNIYGNRLEEGVRWLDANDSNSKLSIATGSWNVNGINQDYPVSEVTWYGAQAYCEWVGGRLPTEAEWEKAARGTDGRTYPWGNQSPTNNLVNYKGNQGGTTEVGSYPEGMSPYGAMDMAGNVREWVADWYDSKYYSVSLLNNPTGSPNSIYKVLRGGSWLNNETYIRSTDRLYFSPTNSNNSVGFRCIVLE